jgi:hypothetical protein
MLKASLFPPRCDHGALTIHLQSHPLVLVACPMGGHIVVRQEGSERVKTQLLQRSVQPSAQGLCQLGFCKGFEKIKARLATHPEVQVQVQ